MTNVSILNQTAGVLTYLSGSISVPASPGSTVVSSSVQILALATDGKFRSDILINNIIISDGTNTFGNNDAIQFMDRLVQVIGPNSDGVGNNITSTLIGSKQSLDINVSGSLPSSDKSGSGTIIATNGTVAANTTGCSTVNFILTGTWSALLLIEGTVDGGVTWSFLNGDSDATDTITTTVSGNTLLTVPCGGLQQVRLRAITYTSGTVSISWNSGVGIAIIETFTTDRNGSGSISALNGAVVANTQSASTVQINVTGTWVATLILEGFLNGNWITISGDIDTTDSVATTFTINGLVTVNCGGFAQIRVRASIYTSGTIVVDWNSSAGIALVEVFNGNGNVLNVSTKTALTPSSPTNFTAGVTSVSAVAVNSNRKGLVLTNISKNIIYFGIGVPAVLNSGIVLYPGGNWVMDEFNFTTSAINAIASAASSVVAIQEFSI